MRKRAPIVIAILMILAGLSLLLYPTVSNYLNNLDYRRTISKYIANVEPLDEESHDEFLAAAQAYNERLAKKSEFMLVLSEGEQAEYNSLLDIDSTGIMGYVSVPKIRISLPIYHGTSDEVLQSGVGHMEGSSLPVGGPGTHAVLSAHTGLPSTKLFTDLDQLEEGDTFTVRVLKRSLTYQVDQILIVLPYETDTLQIEPGEDYCTLVTCTPYGINSHRLLVRGHRIHTPEEGTSSDIEDEDLDSSPLFVLITKLIALTFFLLILAAFLRTLWDRAWRRRVLRWILIVVKFPAVFLKTLQKYRRKQKQTRIKQRKKNKKASHNPPGA